MKLAAFRILFAALVLVTLTLCVDAQSKPVPKAERDQTAIPCPQLSFNAPGGRIFKDGETLSFSASLSGGDTSVTPTFVWSASAGIVASGQGTKSMHLDSTGAGNDRQITVDLWVGGFAPECMLQTNTTVRVVPPAAKVLEFGELTPEKESEQITAFISQLPPANDNLYVFGYAGRTNPRGFANTVLKRLKAQLLASGISYERMAFIDGGFREQPAFEIWLVPVGADAPRAKPTLALKDIVFPKTTPTKKP